MLVPKYYVDDLRHLQNTKQDPCSITLTDI